jgi:hypothetical protein
MGRREYKIYMQNIAMSRVSTYETLMRVSSGVDKFGLCFHPDLLQVLCTRWSWRALPRRPPVLSMLKF